MKSGCGMSGKLVLGWHHLMGVRDTVTAQWHSWDCLGLRNNSGGGEIGSETPKCCFKHPGFCPRSVPSGTGGAAEVWLHSLEPHQENHHKHRTRAGKNMSRAAEIWEQHKCSSKEKWGAGMKSGWWRQGGDNKQVTASTQAPAKSAWTGGDQQQGNEKSLHGLQMSWFWTERKKPGQQSWGSRRECGDYND